MTTDTAPPASPCIDIFVVSHTNVGKTSLVRTLLGQDVGEVEDAPDVTQALAAYDLVVAPDGGALRLWDTPGFGDSFRLAGRLRRKQRWLAWLVREVWDRRFHPALWRGQRLALELRARASVVLYPVNLLESPVDAVYVAPELEILAWVGKPVLVLLNQGGEQGAAGHRVTRLRARRVQQREQQPRQHADQRALPEEVQQRGRQHRDHRGDGISHCVSPRGSAGSLRVRHR